MFILKRGDDLHFGPRCGRFRSDRELKVDALDQQHPLPDVRSSRTDIGDEMREEYMRRALNAAKFHLGRPIVS
jgi:hypothetical protein